MQLFLYQPGASWLHRRSVAAKFGLFVPLSLGLFAVGAWPVLAGALALAAVALASTGLSWRQWMAALRWPLVAIAALGLLNGWLVGPAHALTVSLRLATLVLVASAITASTPVSALLAAIERALLPLERRGWLHAQKVAFTLSLTLTLVPVIFEQLRLAREAQVARGAERHVLALLGPVLVRVMKAADELAEAVEARGFPRPLLDGASS